MGYEQMSLVISATVSRHNSDRDKRHDELWQEVKDRIDEIIEDPKYAEIILMR
jgi:hypothetical protein